MTPEEERLVELGMHVARNAARKIYRTAPHALEESDLLSLSYFGLVQAAGRWYSYCLTPDTPILRADLRWVPLGSLQVGDELVGVDEYPPGGAGKSRTMQRSEVLETSRRKAEVMQLTMEDGRKVVCTPDHPWLVKRSMGAYKAQRLGLPTSAYQWQQTRELKKGSKINAPFEIWEDASSFDEGWLAGIFDGEGSLTAGHNTAKGVKYSRASLTFSQKQGAVLEKAKRVLTEMGIHFTENDHAPGGGYTVLDGYDVKTVNIGTRKDIIQTLGRLRPVRMDYDKAWVNGKVGTPGGKGAGCIALEVVDIRPMGVQEVVTLETSTHTYIANGMITHNCERKDYDPTRIDYFYVFASRRCSGAIMDELRARDYAGRSLRAKSKRLRDAGQDKGASLPEMAQATGMSVPEVAEIINFMKNRPVSLEGEGSDREIDQTTESQANVRELLSEMVKAVQGLPDDAKVVLTLRYYQGMQLQQVARELKVPESLISTLHTSAVLTVHEALLRSAKGSSLDG